MMSQNFFHVPEEAVTYLNGIEGDRELSACLAIHMAWLCHSSPIARGERLTPVSPVDLLLLYRITAATFAEWPPCQEMLKLPQGGNVLNREQAERKLNSIADGRVLKLATLFAQHAVVLSPQAQTKQDLEYLIELFLRCIRDHSVEDIASGAIARREKKPIDLDAITLDYWR